MYICIYRDREREIKRERERERERIYVSADYLLLSIYYPSTYYVLCNDYHSVSVWFVTLRRPGIDNAYIKWDNTICAQRCPFCNWSVIL